MKKIYFLALALILAVSTIAAPTILGPSTVCVGASITLTGGSSTAPGTWSSSDPATATIGASTGIVTGIAPGVVTITFTASTGSATKLVTVNPAPGAITGPTDICLSSTVTLTDTPSGGVWSTTSGSVSVGSSTGTVTGLTAGTATITYSAAGCYSLTTVTVSTTTAPISGPISVCPGGTVTLTDASGPGTWSQSSPLYFAVSASTGTVSGISVGSATITFTPSSGCGGPVTLTFSTVPAPSAISGPTTVCTGNTITLTDPTSGGAWSATPSATGTIAPTSGVVTGLGAGILNVTYSTGAGCSVTTPITVNPAPAAITGLSAVCAGSTVTLSDATSGGSWSLTVTIASVGTSSGVVTTHSAGTAIITYTLPSGCRTTFPMTINPLPAAITGTLTVCTGSHTTLADATSGGVWSSGATGVATVGSLTGVVNGISAGTAAITYALTTGCSVAATVTVNGLPCTSGTNQTVTFEKMLRIYPNPASSELFIDPGTLVFSGCAVTDLMGRLVTSQSLSSGTQAIDVSRFPQGMYLVYLQGEDGYVVSKFVKN